MHIYASCGVWKFDPCKGWRFAFDKEKGGRVLAVELTSSFEDLRTTAFEDFGIDQNDVELELSYLPMELISTIDCPPVIIGNDRQVKNFLTYVRGKASSRLCVSISHVNANNDNIELDKEQSNASGRERREPPSVSPGDDIGSSSQSSKDGEDECNLNALKENEDVDLSGKEEDRGKSVRFSLKHVVKTGETFQKKSKLKAALEMSAMKNNFDYKVVNSDRKLWYIRCVDNKCRWSVRAEGLSRSTYFIIKKYVADHTCAASNMNNGGRTASAKTIGSLIMHRYDGVKEGPKANDIIQIMRMEHGCEISKSLAWDASEYAINLVRGIPEQSFGKILKYLHMLKEANPGTHTFYETDVDGKFRFLFLSFGQSSKYKGVLLVATALDGNSNLYPIAFAVVDSENDRSWDWFFRQLKVVVPDERALAFVSDRNNSLCKGLENVYPLSQHGICIHHLLNNVVTHYRGKGVVGLIAKASKAYRVVDFQKRFEAVCNISPAIGEYLTDADVTKWDRCQFQGYRYDIRMTNPAESINSALRSPREYPVIPLLDSIREMLTRWFFERRTRSRKHTMPLTIAIKKKIDRRINKGKTFLVQPVNEHHFLVRGDTIDCLVDLDRRTCSCRKYDILKIPCRHAIKAGLTVGRAPSSLTDFMYTTSNWRTAYEETINPIGVPEDSWVVPDTVRNADVLAPESRRVAGRRRKCRYETVEDKLRSSQGAQEKKRRRCSRCGEENHNRATCDRAI
ncbi:PREDICTED: uncharacterized protein LOC106314716 [Brassica oleracea var. oleracea]|uniref:uncharacterized protein LOC106314716 n=1 Tax=Brassica oleracea var. oleracea TaxID=109376 RepID=UPI0006A6FD6D|nr:PREDICTED: uncharacterized protein LOC106314716 [Brassica oleracea var. oleracea]